VCTAGCSTAEHLTGACAAHSSTAGGQAACRCRRAAARAKSSSGTPALAQNSSAPPPAHCPPPGATGECPATARGAPAACGGPLRGHPVRCLHGVACSLLPVLLACRLNAASSINACSQQSHGLRPGEAVRLVSAGLPSSCTGVQSPLQCSGVSAAPAAAGGCAGRRQKCTPARCGLRARRMRGVRARRPALVPVTLGHAAIEGWSLGGAQTEAKLWGQPGSPPALAGQAKSRAPACLAPCSQAFALGVVWRREATGHHGPP
jgi:hypothetical protein